MDVASLSPSTESDEYKESIPFISDLGAFPSLYKQSFDPIYDEVTENDDVFLQEYPVSETKPMVSSSVVTSTVVPRNASPKLGKTKIAKKYAKKNLSQQELDKKRDLANKQVKLLFASMKLFSEFHCISKSSAIKDSLSVTRFSFKVL